VESVFVDHTGRRRRLFTSLGAGFGVLLIIGCMLLVAGMLGSSPVPLPGLPDSGQGGLRRDAGVNVGPSPTGPTPGASPDKATPTTPTTATTQPATAAPASTEQPGNRRTSHPTNPRPSRTK
jgi:hypothetical protein